MPSGRGCPTLSGILGRVNAETSTASLPDPSLPDSHDTIRVRGARVNNLKNIDVDLPKRRLTVVTGLSGSGKSSLVFGTVAAESRRLIDETYSAFIQGFMPSLPRPDVDELTDLTAAVIIDQERMGANSRSTVGTATDASTTLRLLFSRLSEPYVGSAKAFSFNLPDGWCPTCEGSGTVADLDLASFLDETKSLNEGAIEAPGFGVGDWYWSSYASNGRLDPDLPVKHYSDEDREFFLYAPTQKIKVAKEDNNGFSTLTFDGLVTRIRRLWIDRDTPPKQKNIMAFVEKISTTGQCPSCHGARLSEAARTATVAGKTLPECSAMQVGDLLDFLTGVDATSLGPALTTLTDQLAALVSVGLGYLSLDRPAGTLSGGEAQRVKMIRHLGSALSDVTYVFDEPTVGLHPHDITRMNTLLTDIRDKGNTVLVVEHKPEVIRAADLVVDLGPGSGDHGGEVVFTGTPRELEAASTVTAESLHQGLSLRDTVRPGSGVLPVGPVTLNNLVDVSADIPLGTLTVLTGVAGSGKSSLVTGGLVGREGVAVVDQSAIRGSRRSTPATYTGMLDDIRKLFARRNRDAGATASMFSPNSDGACPTCHGQGVIYTDLAMMAGVSAPCEDCAGRRFRPEVLEYRVAGRDISEVLDMTVAEASTYFTQDAPSKPVAAALSLLRQVGLDYLRLGQPLTTLSGGERQRLKLASRIDGDAPVIVLDEPTTGLHLADTATLVEMMQNLVDAGHTLVVIEHNLAVIAAADHIIDIGPGAGHDGGQVVFEGSPAELVSASAQSANLTGRYLAAAVH